MREHLHSGERFGRNANHGEFHAVQANAPAEHRGAAGEFRSPEIRAQNDHSIAAGHAVFILPKTAPQPRLDTEYAEVITGDQHSTLDPRSGSWVGAETHGLHVGVGDYAIVAFRRAANVQVFA